MRIEKINDHQIRCTLNQKDLSDRELRISELAYGTDKAKTLFRDMMQQASYEFGFEADDIPLMIEAIPMYPDTLVLVITKVDDPDELDTRFSHFSEEDDSYPGTSDNSVFTMKDDFSNESYADEVISDLEDLDEYMDEDEETLIELEEDESVKDSTSEKNSDFISLSEALGMESRPKVAAPGKTHDLIKIYSFQSLHQLTTLAEYLVYTYQGKNTIYKDEKLDCYYLIVHKTDHTPEEFNKICNIICEYGKPLRNTYASHSYYQEHFEPLIKENALQVLASI